MNFVNLSLMSQPFHLETDILMLLAIYPPSTRSSEVVPNKGEQNQNTLAQPLWHPPPPPACLRTTVEPDLDGPIRASQCAPRSGVTFDQDARLTL